MEIAFYLAPLVIGGIAGGGTVVLLALFSPKRTCPDCSTPLPRFRKPQNMNQLLWGGWTCPHCVADLNRCGQKVVCER